MRLETTEENALDSVEKAVQQNQHWLQKMRSFLGGLRSDAQGALPAVVRRQLRGACWSTRWLRASAVSEGRRLAPSSLWFCSAAILRYNAESRLQAAACAAGPTEKQASVSDLAKLYQEQILEHHRAPRNAGRLPDPTHSAEAHNPLCGDRVRLTLRLGILPAAAGALAEPAAARVAETATAGAVEPAATEAALAEPAAARVAETATAGAAETETAGAVEPAATEAALTEPAAARVAGTATARAVEPAATEAALAEPAAARVAETATAGDAETATAAPVQTATGPLGVLEARCDTQGCALCRASGSMLTELIIGQGVLQVTAWLERFLALAGTPPGSHEGEDAVLVGAVQPLLEVRKFPSRRRCVTLGWEALRAALQEPK